MKAICAALGFWFALLVMLPHHTTYTVSNTGPAAVSIHTEAGK